MLLEVLIWTVTDQRTCSVGFCDIPSSISTEHSQVICFGPAFAEKDITVNSVVT